MDADRWLEIKTHFEAALDLSPPERTAYLDRICADDAALRREIEALLASDDDAGGFLEAPPPLPDTLGATDPEANRSSRWIGRRIGAYRLTHLLGRGGMGAVYAAERADSQFEQRVAIKLVRWDADTDELRQRFHTERQILADLTHPNIARLLGGGVTDDGVPYLVMEHVDGQPITEYCDAQRLPLDARLRLFRTVCNAVQHAHQNLVVHRDLKPSNILVTTDGTVKLLDFGIAKLLASTSAEKAHPPTRTGLQVLTPEYAAPEQIRSQPITTATDIYQLGVLLYELLTGQRPYRVRGHSPGDIERIICSERPVKPSVAATRRIDGAAPDSTEHVLPARLKGDLDNIVLKALRKEPPRRYRSAEQFADDIRRSQHNLPVSARPSTLRYRTAKFIRRNRVIVAAAMLALVSLIGGTAVALWQARAASEQRQRAEQRLTDIRKLAGSFLFEFHDAIADLPGSTEARELVVQRALEYLDRLAQQAPEDRALQLDLASAYGRVGDVQGNPTNANLGRTQDALASYQKGLAMAHAALRADSTQPEARLTLANLYEKLGDVQAAAGSLAEAETSKRRAVNLYRDLAQNAPDEAELQVNYAVALIKLGDLLGNPNFPNRGQPAAALDPYRRAKSILQPIYAANPAPNNTMRLVGLVHERIGTIHDLAQRTDSALAAYQTSLALRKQYADAHPARTNATRDWAIAHEKIGEILHQTGQLQAARDRHQQARDIFARLAEADPSNVQAQQSLAISHIHLGELSDPHTPPSFSTPTTARAHYERARQLLESVHQGDSTNARTRSLLDLVDERLARLL